MRNSDIITIDTNKFNTDLSIAIFHCYLSTVYTVQVQYSLPIYLLYLKIIQSTTKIVKDNRWSCM